MNKDKLLTLNNLLLEIHGNRNKDPYKVRMASESAMRIVREAMNNQEHPTIEESAYVSAWESLRTSIYGREN